MAADLTTEILIQIRDEIRKTNERLDATNERLDVTRKELSSRLDATREELSSRLERVEKQQTESEIRLATEIVALAGAVREVRDLLREDRLTREAVQKHDVRIADVEQRLVAVERKVS